ncbi:MAG: GHMP kinase [Chloroflexi bacterium]|nr:MAG: GHMP kinase [Chloroflexota bacterium]
MNRCETPRRLVRARTPLRISLGGGGTDIDPYPRDHGGIALTIAIDLYAHAELIAHHEPAPFCVESRDLNRSVSFECAQDLELTSDLDLAKAAIRRVAPHTLRDGLELITSSDAPLGSGLGGSSAMTATMLGALHHYIGDGIDHQSLASEAFEVERLDVGLAGGRQDQYACVHGGVNLIEFDGEATVVHPLSLDPAQLDNLERSLLLCDTGITRVSSPIIERQVAAYTRRDEDVTDALHRIKAAAFEMHDALLAGDLPRLGAFLDASWTQKQRFDPAVTNPAIDALYSTALEAGAYGGKLLGAGGGGHLLLLTPPERREQVAQRLAAVGGTPRVVGFDLEGFVAWDETL